MTLLVDLGRATDEGLRRQARALARRVLLDRARTGALRRSGAARLRSRPADAGGELDLDASLGAVLEARAGRRRPAADELVARDWARPELALVVLVDASGSMNGARLAAAALTAAACALRAPGDCAVLSFNREVRVLRAMDATARPELVVDAVLGLQGHGVTALATALTAAAGQLDRTSAARRVVLLLSDCRATDEQDPVAAAAALPELCIVAPADDSDAAVALARRAGGRVATLPGASAAPEVIAELLG